MYVLSVDLIGPMRRKRPALGSWGKVAFQKFELGKAKTQKCGGCVVSKDTAKTQSKLREAIKDYYYRKAKMQLGKDVNYVRPG